MSNFVDTFDRGDGWIGNGWTLMAPNTLYISSGYCVGWNGTAGRARRPVETTAHSVRIRALSIDGVNPALPILYAEYTTDTSHYSLTAGYSAGVLTLTLTRYYNTAQIIAQQQFATDTPLDITLELRRVGSLVSGYWNGELVLTAYNNVVPANAQIGFGVGNLNTKVDWVEANDEATMSITVNPDATGLQNGEVELMLSGVNTEWTPGTPGSPTFQVRGATWISQWVAETNLAYVVVGGLAVTNYGSVTDPSSGESANLTITNDPTVVTTGDPNVNANLAAILAYSARLDQLLLGSGGAVPDPISNWLQKVIDWFALYAPASEGGAHELAAIIETLGTSSASPETLRYVIELIRQIVAANAVRLDAMTGEGAWDLADVAITVQGAGSKTIADVLDSISAVRGVNNVDLTGVFSSLYNLRTANGYTLGDVSTWISNLSEPDLSAVLSAISGVSDDVAAVKAVVDGIGAYSDAAVLAAIAALALALTATETATLGAIGTVGTAVTAGAVENTAGWLAAAAGFVDVLAAIGGIASTLSNLSVDLQPVLDDIADLATLVDERFDLIDTALVDMSAQIAALGSALDKRLPIIFPGSSLVTWGDPVEINATGVVNGPMDGVKIELNYVPPDIGHQAIPGHDRYMYLGACVFSLASGDLDERQQINWDQAIYVPRTSSNVDNLVVRCRPGVTLTVTPWTLAAV